MEGKEAHSMKKVIILIGNYGSGKTEIALNMALKASEEGKKTQVIDLDRINDYFRMSDNVNLLEEGRINLVSPTFAGQGVTQTNMPAAVGSARQGRFHWRGIIRTSHSSPPTSLRYTTL